MIYIKMQQQFIRLIINFFSVFAVISIVIYWSYSRGYAAAENKARNERLQMEQQVNERLQKIQQQHSDSIAGYIESINTLERQHESDVAEIQKMKFAGAIDVSIDEIKKDDDGNHHNNRDVGSGVQQCSTGENRVSKTKTESDFLCFRKSEFHRTFQKSLDIVAECDRLAVKYNALLKTCAADELE